MEMRAMSSGQKIREIKVAENAKIKTHQPEFLLQENALRLATKLSFMSCPGWYLTFITVASYFSDLLPYTPHISTSF